MIIIEKIRFKNICSVGNYFVEIELNKYRNIIFVGENGTGKTSVLQAITFGLFGKPFTSVKIGSLINSINNKNLVVEIFFSKGSTQYKIIRGLKPDIFEIYENGVLKKQDARKNDYQEYLDTILGFDFKTFTKVIILGSAVHVPVMQLSAKERRDLIEKLLDLEVFSYMNDYSKKQLKDINEKIKENDDIIYKLEINIETKERYQKEIIGDIENKINIHNLKIKDIQTRIDKIREGMQSDIDKLATVDVSKYEENLKSYEKEYDKFRRDQITIEAENAISKKTLKFLDEYDVCPTCNQLLDEIYKTQIYENTIIADDEGIKIAILDVKGKIENVKKSLTKIDVFRDGIIEKNNKIRAYEKEIKIYKDEIETLNTSVEDNSNDKQIDEFKKLLKEKGKTKDILKEEKTIIDVALLLLKDEGIKASIIKKYVGLINILINQYLEKFDFFVKFELNENFEETLKSRHIDKFSYLNFSEGEKRRIDLAVLFVLKDISKKKNNVSCNLMAFDETLERIDEAGADCFVKLLRGFDTNNIIISHNDVVINKFNSEGDSIIKVFKKGKFSYYEKL